jgi:ABC-type transport system involved in cytochrome bd biosynthesis fused ATPase/permease subunit
LEAKTEESIIKNLNKFKGEKIFLIIAHRISALKYWDYLYCLNNGIVSKEGKNEEVINASSKR